MGLKARTALGDRRPLGLGFDPAVEPVASVDAVLDSIYPTITIASVTNTRFWAPSFDPADSRAGTAT